MDTFSLERAANLHNEVLRRAIAHDPSITTEPNLLDGFLQVTDVDDNFQQHPICHFLSLLETTSLRDQSRPPGLFSPVLYQPDPWWFFDESSEPHPDYMLLYGQNNADAPMDGGVYISLTTGQVTWRNAPFDFEHLSSLPLESFYKILVSNWESGKY